MALYRTEYSDNENIRNHMISELLDYRKYSEYRYKILYDSIPDLLRTVNTDGIIVDCNTSYANAFGYSKNELVGSSIFENIAKESMDTMHKSFETWKKKGKVRNVEIWFKRKDQSTFLGLLSANNLYDKNDMLIGSNTVIQDITEIYNTTKKLEERENILKEQYGLLRKMHERATVTEQKYRDLYEKSPSLLRSIDLNGMIVNCNIAYIEALGYTKKEAIGMNIFDHTAERSLVDLKADFEKWKETHDVSHIEIWMKRKDGSIFPTLLSGASLYDESDNLVGRTVSLTDLTEIYATRNMLEEKEMEIRRQYEELKILSHEKEEYFELLSREIRSSSIKMVNTMNMLLQDKSNPISAIQTDSVQTIKIKAQTILKMLSDIYTMHRIEHDHVPLIKNNHNMAELIKNVIHHLHNDIKTHGCTITTELYEDLICMCDKNSIEGVLVQIIGNAIDFSPRGNGEIHVKLYPQNQYVRIMIKDNGIGISKENLGKIFEKFYQINTSILREHGGAGLGLYICKKIIEMHRGRIWVKSHGHGKGTEVHIILPKFDSEYNKIKKI